MCGSGNACILDDLSNDLSQCLLAEHLIYIRHFLRHELVDDDTSCSSFYHLGSCLRMHLILRKSHADLRMKLDCMLVERNNNFLRTIELEALSLGIRSDLGDIVKTENHIL